MMDDKRWKENKKGRWLSVNATRWRRRKHRNDETQGIDINTFLLVVTR